MWTIWSRFTLSDKKCTLVAKRLEETKGITGALADDEDLRTDCTYSALWSLIYMVSIFGQAKKIVHHA